MIDYVIMHGVYIAGFGCWVLLFLNWYVTKYVVSKVNIKTSQDLMNRYTLLEQLKKERGLK